MVPSQKHGFHLRRGPFLNPHMELVHNSDGFCLSPVQLPSIPAHTPWLQSLLPRLLVSPLLTYSPINQHHALHSILHILARIIFRWTCDPISPLPEASMSSNFLEGKTYQ